MDIALTIEYLIPSAGYYGTTYDNTEEAYNSLTWIDTRSKPTWQAILDNTETAELINFRSTLECSPLQLIQALRITGDYDVVMAMLATLPTESYERWDRALVILRADPIVNGLISALGRSAVEADLLFILAISLS
jgi:hypothetical protein